MTTIFRASIALSLLASFAFPTALQSSAYAQPTIIESPSPSAISKPIQVLYTALNTAQTIGKTPQQRTMIIAPAVDQAFDLDTILGRSVGIRYRSLLPTERARLLQSFRQFTIARYASSFKPGSNISFKIQPNTRSNPTGGQIVDTLIGSGPDNTTPLDYIMTQNASGWHITDILLNAHISQVAAQRADFSNTLTQGGASALAATLDQKAAQFLHD